MKNPLFWLGISVLLVAISLMALLSVAIFALQELARTARSAEKLLDTLNKELPVTLQDLRITGKDLSDLSDEVTGSVKSARNVVTQVDKGLTEVKVQTQRAQITTRSLIAGTAAAMKVLIGNKRRRQRPPTRRPPPKEMRPTYHPSAPQNPAPQKPAQSLESKGISTPDSSPAQVQSPESPKTADDSAMLQARDDKKAHSE